MNFSFHLIVKPFNLKFSLHIRGIICDTCLLDIIIGTLGITGILYRFTLSHTPNLGRAESLRQPAKHAVPSAAAQVVFLTERDNTERTSFIPVLMAYLCLM